MPSPLKKGNLIASFSHLDSCRRIKDQNVDTRKPDITASLYIIEKCTAFAIGKTFFVVRFCAAKRRNGG